MLVLLMEQLKAHQQQLLACRRCPDMIPPVIIGQVVKSKIISVGQAPGVREGGLGQPFAWTAGKTLFKWFVEAGVDEATFRKNVYMAAVCRCYPGKNPKSGDRVPNKIEIKNCQSWLDAEFELLKPTLIIPIGKLAINQWIKINKLTDIIGQQKTIERNNLAFDVIALPHPSGLSTWFRRSPGKDLTAQAIQLIKNHPTWQATFN